MKRTELYEAAGLTQAETNAVEASLQNDPADSPAEVSGFDKLQGYFCDTDEMPYAIATQSSWHPDNTCTPDEWIVEQLQLLPGDDGGA